MTQSACSLCEPKAHEIGQSASSLPIAVMLLTTTDRAWISAVLVNNDGVHAISTTTSGEISAPAGSCIVLEVGYFHGATPTRSLTVSIITKSVTSLLAPNCKEIRGIFVEHAKHDVNHKCDCRSTTTTSTKPIQHAAGAGPLPTCTSCAFTTSIPAKFGATITPSLASS
jgi:hypothetical protein